jgi:hypothetical protein
VNIQQVAAVVAKVKLGDNRDVDKLVLQEWEASIGDLDFDMAIEAVSMHRRESTDYLQPAHIRRNVARIKEDSSQGRELKAAWVEHPAPKPDNMRALEAAWNDPQNWAAEVAAYNRQLDAVGYRGRRP